ncbi:GMP synthase-Glutamine amidotransferase [Franzmannia pantelleriensis]|uniref:GMP synthase-Glutamine amidotransferase n=1 Tax=Franzmannia pantelleriensis TaxID=48727 RepID=A0A1G9SWN5_9GAMM|nr:type 1 glutamine amidotransferase [Halomonas pantelleriensis]SDM39856.1 GMP synthase-Glutamine amidotransferase [Halomonas pantelleriensis]
MHIYFLHHADHLGPARLTDWLSGMGHSYNGCLLHRGEAPPRLEDCDALIVLDAPLSLAPSHADWLSRERKLIQRALKSGKPLLGIGFGAELIAEGLGAIVSPGTYPELGFHRITLAADSPFDLPEQFEAFMCHRDIFGLPEGALPLGASAASPVQGFSWDGGRVVALQCHLEATETSTRRYLAATPEALTDADQRFVQPHDEILADPRRFDQLASLLDRVLLDWLRSVPG